MDETLFHELAKQAEEMDVYPNVIFPPSKYYRFLRALASYVRPQVSVELGVCSGGGSLHLALGYPQGKVIGVDVLNTWPINIEYVKETCPNFEFWQMDSIEAAQWWDSVELPMVDILFIDTVHTYDRAMAEFEAWHPLLSADAIVVLDDLFMEGVDAVWQELPGTKVRFDNLHQEGGFGVIFNIG